MDALRRTILYPFKASVPDTYWNVCRLINAVALDLEIEVPVMSVDTGSDPVSYGVAHGYITVGLNKEAFSAFPSIVSYQNIKLPIDISNVVVKYSSLRPVLSATDMPYDPGTAVSGYTVALPGTDNFQALSGINSSVSYSARSTGNSLIVGSLTYKAHPGYGLGKYKTDPWSKEPPALDGSVFNGIKSINGLNLNHNVNIKESSEVLRVLESSESEVYSPEEDVSDSSYSTPPGNPVHYTSGITSGLGFYLVDISINPAAQSIFARFVIESAPIHFQGTTGTLNFGSSSLYIRKYVDFVSGQPGDSSSSVVPPIESSSSISPESSSSVVESSSSGTPESSSSVYESSSSIEESSSAESSTTESSSAQASSSSVSESSSVESSSSISISSSSSYGESSSSISISSSSSYGESSSSVSISSSSSYGESSSSISIESSSSISISSSSSYAESSSSISISSSSSYGESSSSISISSSSSYGESSSSAVYEYIWFEAGPRDPDESSSSISMSSSSSIESSSSIGDSSSVSVSVSSSSLESSSSSVYVESSSSISIESSSSVSISSSSSYGESSSTVSSSSEESSSSTMSSSSAMDSSSSISEVSESSSSDIGSESSFVESSSSIATVSNDWDILAIILNM